MAEERHKLKWNKNVADAARLEIEDVGNSEALSGVSYRPNGHECRRRLRAELGDDLFTSWFGRMDCDGLQGGHLTVSVPTRFLKSWIESHYVTKLQKIARAELGEVSLIQVRVRQQGTPVVQAARPQVRLPADALWR